MRKISFILLIVICIGLIGCELGEIELPNKLNLTAVCYCKDSRIKFMDDNINSYSLYNIMPSNMDFETLAQKGYKIKIEVSYDVYYKKDYDVPFDIGYAGSPKYEVSIHNSDGIGNYKNDLSTKTSSQTKTITYNTTAREFLNTIIYLEFSTDNIQNIIYFKNITVTFTAYK